jgi:hypothetical protein
MIGAERYLECGGGQTPLWLYSQLADDEAIVQHP